MYRLVVVRQESASWTAPLLPTVGRPSSQNVGENGDPSNHVLEPSNQLLVLFALITCAPSHVGESFVVPEFA